MPEEKSVPTVLAELKDLTVTYAKQETVEPIKGLGRYVGFGIGGSVLLGFGLCLLGLAVLRGLQQETGDAFRGNLSFVPYLVATVVLGALAVLSVLQIKKDGGDRER